MKYFFVEINQQDGEHEHIAKAVARGETLEGVQKRVNAEQVYDYGDDGHEYSLVSYFDGETAVNYATVREISEGYFDVLKQFLSEV